MHSLSLKRTALSLALLAALSACGKNFESPARQQEASASAPPAEVSLLTPPPLAAKVSQAPSLAEAAKAMRQNSIAGKVSFDAQQAMPEPGKDVLLTSSATSYADTGHKFIRSGSAQFAVADVYKSALAIEDAAAGNGGFVVGNHISTDIQRVQRTPKGEGVLLELTEYTVRGTLTVRVPSDKTQNFLRAAAEQIEFLNQRNFEARDVQFDLLRQYLAGLRAQETQEELGQAIRDGGKLGQKTEAVAARNDSKAARDEARVAQKEMADKIAYSTIEFTIQQPSRVRQAEVIDSAAVFKQNGPGMGVRLANALHAGWDHALNILLALLRWWPLCLLAASALFIARRAMHNRGQKNLADG
jgi:hypothetical protein